MRTMLVIVAKHFPNTRIFKHDEIVTVDNQLVGDTPLQDLDHVISYIRTYIKSDRPKLSFRFRRIDFPQREIAKMPLDNKTTKKSNSTKKKVGRWLRRRLSSGSDKKKKRSSKSPRSWKASLGGMWAKLHKLQVMRRRIYET